LAHQLKTIGVGLDARRLRDHNHVVSQAVKALGQQR
jgi:hypothetical protein